LYNKEFAVKPAGPEDTMTLIKTLLFVAATALSASVLAEEAAAKPDIAAGQTTAAICGACHGATGMSVAPTFPNLAGQHYDYIVKQLTNFRVAPGATVAQRENAQMAGMAAGLTETQIHDVAAYFSSQKSVPGTARNKESAEFGRLIYRGGIPSKGVAACAGCHGPAGAGIPGQFPRLSGQWADYAEAQLVAFRQGTRKNNAMMANVAARLSDTEIKAVSDYISGLR
jgi:cytochrome c553